MKKSSIYISIFAITLTLSSLAHSKIYQGGFDLSQKSSMDYVDVDLVNITGPKKLTINYCSYNHSTQTHDCEILGERDYLERELREAYWLERLKKLGKRSKKFKIIGAVLDDVEKAEESEHIDHPLNMRRFRALLKEVLYDIDSTPNKSADCQDEAKRIIQQIYGEHNVGKGPIFAGSIQASSTSEIEQFDALVKTQEYGPYDSISVEMKLSDGYGCFLRKLDNTSR